MPPFYANPAFYLYAFTLLPFALFCVLYPKLAHGWWRNPVGRGLMAMSGSMVAVLLFVVLAIVGFIPREWLQMLRTVTLSGVALAGWWQLKNFIQIQRAARGSDCPRRRSTDIP